MRANAWWRNWILQRCSEWAMQMVCVSAMRKDAQLARLLVNGAFLYPGDSNKFQKIKKAIIHPGDFPV